MSSPHVEKLISLLSKLPGIGPRQAGRLVFHLLDEKKELIDALIASFSSLKEVKRCSVCFQAYEGEKNICSLCLQVNRNKNCIMVVEKDMDFINIEKAGIHDGLYHILGGVISPLRPDSQSRLRLKELHNRVLTHNDIHEVILATSATPEGDHTARYIEKILEPFLQEKNIKITRLARGLSTGTELEYSDSETFKSAYLNRK